MTGEDADNNSSIDYKGGCTAGYPFGSIWATLLPFWSGGVPCFGKNSAVFYVNDVTGIAVSVNYLV